MKETVKKGLSNSVADELNPEAVQAVEYAEVGAQGCSQKVTIVTDQGGKIVLYEGSFGLEGYGTRLNGDVDVERLERLVPFLRHFRGTCEEDTVRCNCMSKDRQWVHLNAGFGNHFFIRETLAKKFIALFKKENARSLYEDALRITLAILDVM